MGSIPWILTAILVILIMIGLFSRLSTRNREKTGVTRETNYRMFFKMGLIMSLVGLAGIITSIILDYSFLTAMPVFSIGLVYLVIGWSKRDTWKKGS